VFSLEMIDADALENSGNPEPGVKYEDSLSD
jgi:hypothetical protein